MSHQEALFLKFLLASAVLIFNEHLIVPDSDNQFDYIVVGGGSAGSVVAARLSEDPKVRVLLIEAGGEPSRFTDCPGLSVQWRQTKLTKKIKTASQPHACRVDGGHCTWTFGRALGGGSTINGMVYVRGNRKDYEGWQLANWTFDDVIPYFKKMESKMDINPCQHQLNQYPKLTRRLLVAAKSLQFNVGNYNCDQDQGVFSQLFTSFKNGVRKSSETSYLRKIRKARHNLVIQTWGHVNSINFDDNKTAISVNYDFNGTNNEAFASKEIILSAGALNSPKILMNSGIGPKSQLEELGIKVIKNSKGVGHNLHDHVCIPISIRTNYSIEKTNLEDDWNEYNKSREGKLRFTRHFGIAFLKRHQSTDDVINQLTFSAYPSEEQLKSAHNHSHLATLQFTVTTCVQSPKSRGTIKLSSKDPYDDLILDPNYLSHESDQKDLEFGVKTVVQLISTKPFQEIAASLGHNSNLKECEKFFHHQHWSDDYVNCLIKFASKTGHHYVGTAKMGHRGDDQAVVDEQLRVIGVHSLRVMDASAIPKIIKGNTNAVATMIGEKGSDFIKRQFKIDKASQTE